MISTFYGGSRPVLRGHMIHTQELAEAIFQRVTRPGCEANHSLISSTNIKDENVDTPPLPLVTSLTAREKMSFFFIFSHLICAVA